MKKILFILLAVSVLSASVFAQDKPAGEKATGDMSEITFKKTENNFGLLPYKGDGTCEFIFKNTGKSPLILTNVKSSCGCTIPTWPREPIAPGEEQVIKVKYDTKRQGKFSKTITVYSNASNSPVRLVIKGEVEQPSAEELEKLRLEREKRAAARKARQQNSKPAEKNAAQSLQKQKSLPAVK